MHRIFILLSLNLLFPVATAEPAVLLVKATDVEYTEYSTCSDDDCVPFYFWFIYEADVKKVVAGTYENATVRFVHLQHTYFTKEVTDHLYVVLAQTENEEFDEHFGTRLVASDLAFPRTAVCFDDDMRDLFPDSDMFEFSRGELESQNCYYELDDEENGNH